MTVPGIYGSSGLIPRQRTLEWWGAGVCLFLQTGAIFPLMLLGPDGSLDDDARAKLRLLALPTYLITGALLARHARQLLIALRRNLPLVLLLGLPFLSVVWSLSPSISLRRSIALLCSISLSYLLATRFTPRQLLVLVGAVLLPCVVLSLVLMAVSPGLARMPMETDMRGIFVHKNVLGWIAAVSVIVAGNMVADPSLGFRRTGIVFLLASVACLILSQSATAMLAAIAGLCLALLFVRLTRMRGPSRVVLVLVFLQAAALLLVWLDQYLVPLLESLGKDATLTGRVPLWALVDEQIGSHILFGFGYQAFWTTGNGRAWGIWSDLGWMTPHSHNGFRDTMLSLGLVGLCVLMLVIFRAVRVGGILLCRQPQDGWLWPNVFVGQFLVMNLTESIFLAQNDFFFILFATALVMFSLRFPELHRSGQNSALALERVTFAQSSP